MCDCCGSTRWKLPDGIGYPGDPRPRGFAPLAHHRIQNFNFRRRRDHTCKALVSLSEVVSLAMGVQRLRAFILLHDLIDLRVRRAAMQRIENIPGLVRAHQFGQIKEGVLKLRILALLNRNRRQ